MSIKKSPKKMIFTHKSICVPMKSFPQENLNQALNLLIYGIKVSKLYKSSKLSHDCIFYILEDDCSYLQWISRLKSYHQTRIDLKTIQTITDNPSFDSKILKKFKNFKKLTKLLFFSYGDINENKVLILKFNDLKEKHFFWQGVQFLSKKAIEKEFCFGDVRKLIAQKLFLKADQDGSKTLDYEEIKKILQQLHIEINQDFLIKFFAKYDKDKNHSIDWQEFQSIIDDISLKNEIKPVFMSFCQEARNLKTEENFIGAKMEFSEFQTFLKKEQKQILSETEFQKMLYLIHSNPNDFLGDINNSFSEDKEKQKLSINFSEFCSILFSRNNEIFDPEKLDIYQNMSRPLTDYYINTSHNTYLLANQLTGESSTKAYINAFAKGCRCVELDCWEGDKGEPIIYHGYTFTSKILFREVIQTIKDYAFVSNPYPVILSLENHCKQKQQDKMAEIMVDILGDYLYVLPDNYADCEKFPSPQELKYKILVKDKAKIPLVEKGKKNIFMNSPDFDWDILDNRHDIECEEDQKYIISKEINFQNFAQKNEINFFSKHFMTINLDTNFALSQKIQILQENNVDKSMQNPINQGLDCVNEFSNIKKQGISSKLSSNSILTEKSLLNDLNNLSAQKINPKSDSSNFEISPSPENSRRQAISQSLKQLLALYGIKMSLNAERTLWNISSIKEPRFEKFSKEYEDHLQDFLRKYFLRVYPSGTRVDSSNFDPIECFNFGVQMVALNVQTPDLPLLLYMSKFRENGGVNCGYVLKPDFLLKETQIYLKKFTRILKVICIDVISGQQLRPENEEDVRDVVDPYVEVNLRGASIDERENAKVFRSKVVYNNGFNPIFDLNCQFKLSCPELALLVFKVFDQEIAMKDMKIGWNAIPLSCMRPGYRIVPLLNSNLNQIEFSCLLCKVEIKEVVME